MDYVHYSRGILSLTLLYTSFFTISIVCISLHYFYYIVYFFNHLPFAFKQIIKSNAAKYYLVKAKITKYSYFSGSSGHADKLTAPLLKRLVLQN